MYLSRSLSLPLRLISPHPSLLCLLNQEPIIGHVIELDRPVHEIGAAVVGVAVVDVLLLLIFIV